MLELAILGLLKEREMHGYELRKQIAAKLGLFWTVSFGSVYPTLRKLERHGAVVKAAGSDTASRRKQVYRITSTGEQMFLELLTEGPSSAWEEEKFPLRLAFFRYLRPDTRIKLLERRKSVLEARLDESRATLKRVKRGRSDPYTLSLFRHGIDATAADIAWLEELIATERTALAEGEPSAAAKPPPGDATTDPQPAAGPAPATPDGQPAPRSR